MLYKSHSFCYREPCCGTHVHNSADLEDFYIISSKSLGRSTTSLRAVTGPQAKIANKVGLELIEEVTNLQKKIDDNIDKVKWCLGMVILLQQNFYIKYQFGKSQEIQNACKLVIVDTALYVGFR